MKLQPYDELVIETVSKDGFALRKFVVKVKKEGGLKVLEKAL